MILKIKEKEIEIEKIKNIYPSAIVEMDDGSETPISLEWADQNRDKVNISRYAVLVVMNDNSKINIYFDKFEEMINTLKNLHDKLKSKS